MKTRTITVLIAGAALLTTAGTAVAAAPTVQMMVIGKSRTLMPARTIALRPAQLTIGRRRCRVVAGTALAGLIAARLKPRVSNAAGCDPASMFVTRIGPDANRGIAGWQYKLGHRSPSLSAGDPGGRLRTGQQLLWFWCVRASACQRTLDVAVNLDRLNGSTRATVTGYDDNGHGRRIAGATVHVDGTTLVTGAAGTVTTVLTPGRHTLYATKAGLVPSFPVPVTR